MTFGERRIQGVLFVLEHLARFPEECFLFYYYGRYGSIYSYSVEEPFNVIQKFSLVKLRLKIAIPH